MDSYKRNSWYNWSCLLQIYCCLNTKEKVSVGWQFSETCGSGWRKDVVNKDLGFGQEAGCCVAPPFPAPHQVQHCGPSVSFKRGQGGWGSGNHGKSKPVSVTHWCWHAYLVALEDFHFFFPPRPWSRWICWVCLYELKAELDNHQVQVRMGIKV